MASLCDQCAGLCCRYFVLEIDKPEDRGDFDNVRWYLVHENTFVFIEKRKWYLGVYARCKHLQADNRCGIYETRPQICRGYSTDNCDYHGGEYDWEVLFTSADQLQRYADEHLPRKRRSRKPEAGSRKKKESKRPRGRAGKPPRLHVTLLAGGPDRAPRGSGPRTGAAPANGVAAAAAPAGGANGHAGRNGKAVPLPVLRG